MRVIQHSAVRVGTAKGTDMQCRKGMRTAAAPGSARPTDNFDTVNDRDQGRVDPVGTGMPPNIPVAPVENDTRPEQRVLSAAIATLPELAG
jgi:hypothetical protein